MTKGAACLATGLLALTASWARAQSSASFGDSPPSDSPTDESANPSSDETEPDTEGRELRPYVRPPYQPDDKQARRRSRTLRRRQSPYHHDGFYFRTAAGIGFGTDRLEGSFVDYDFPREDGRRGRMGGFAVPTEIAMGYTVGPGVVTGVGVYNSVWPSPRADAGEGTADYEFRASQLALFGPMVDVYPRPHDGWHVQGSLGVASFNVGFGSVGTMPPRPVQSHVTVGLGFMLGGGYEWFVAEQWSVGLLVRTMRGYSAGSDGDGGSWTHRTQTYSLLVTLTRH